jgi:hypothetical protein
VLQAAATAGGETARSNLCITAKLGLDDSAPNKVEAACRSILAETGLDYLDCFIVQPVQSIKVCTILPVLKVLLNCDARFPALLTRYQLRHRLYCGASPVLPLKGIIPRRTHHGSSGGIRVALVVVARNGGARHPRPREEPGREPLP